MFSPRPDWHLGARICRFNSRTKVDPSRDIEYFFMLPRHETNIIDPAFP
jgi:hypothetical protein